MVISCLMSTLVLAELWPYRIVAFHDDHEKPSVCEKMCVLHKQCCCLLADSQRRYATFASSLLEVLPSGRSRNTCQRYSIALENDNSTLLQLLLKKSVFWLLYAFLYASKRQHTFLYIKDKICFETITSQLLVFQTTWTTYKSCWR